VAKPNLYRETFPYTEFPRVIFDNENVEYDIPENIWITDTTFRDGQQSRPPYTPEQILHIYDLLHKIDGDTGLIRQCEFFLYSERDRKAVELCKERSYKFPEITGWIRAVPADFKLVSQMGLKETGILTSASDYHIFLKLKKTRAQALDTYGLGPLDALHIACAEAAQADRFCTCDDELVRKVTRIPDLGVTVITPVELVKELER